MCLIFATRPSRRCQDSTAEGALSAARRRGLADKFVECDARLAPDVEPDEDYLPMVAAPRAMPERGFVAPTSGCCFCVTDASFGRLKTTASMAFITFCCMIWFLSIVRCPTPI